MKKLILKEWETKFLMEHSSVYIKRKGFAIIVKKDKDYDYLKYIITVVNPYDIVVLKKEVKK